MSCKKLMCKHKLNDKSITMKWLKKNHPDKGGNNEIFDEITKAYFSLLEKLHSYPFTSFLLRILS